jgi:hypothetical protein
MVLFDYTQRTFWGGSWYPYWSLIVITIFGGLFGLDHFWLRSPTTGIIKFIANIFGLGIWWLYDMIQILGEKDSVMKNGLSAPVVGPLGIGAGMFTDDHPGQPLGKSPFRFIAYLFLLWIPFGFDFFVAGDSGGAMAKFVCTVVFMLWPIAFIWSAVNLGRAVFMPKSLFTEGTFRMFPINFLMDPTGPSVLGPVDVGVSLEDERCENKRSGGILGFLGDILGSIAAPIIGALLPGVQPAAAAISGATQAVAMGVTESAEAITSGVKTVVDSIAIPTAQVVGTGAQLATQVPGAIDSVSGIGSQVTQGIGAMTSEEGLKKLAQKGGGGASSDMSTLGLLVLFTILLGGGTFMAVRRMNLKNPWSDKENASDTPPKPRRV